MAKKKRSSRRTAGERGDRVAAPETSDPGAPERDREAAGEAGSEHNAETIEEKRVTKDTGEEPDAAAGEGGEGDESPSAPSARDVLNRLLEKNEIILDLNRQNAEKDKKLKDLNDKWLRSVAEFENYRKRSRKEWELLQRQSRTEVILEILSIVDDFERAFSVAEDRDDEFVQGIRLIYNNLVGVLDKFGVQEIDAANSPFDPNFHMAVGQIESQDVEPGRVVEVIQKGYRIDDTVIRPARVIVAK